MIKCPRQNWLSRCVIAGMDYPSCAAKIEASARSVPSVQDARVSVASPETMLQINDAAAPLPRRSSRSPVSAVN
jgi:cation transport ATPase